MKNKIFHNYNKNIKQKLYNYNKKFHYKMNN